MYLNILLLKDKSKDEKDWPILDKAMKAYKGNNARIYIENELSTELNCRLYTFDDLNAGDLMFYACVHWFICVLVVYIMYYTPHI